MESSVRINLLKGKIVGMPFRKKELRIWMDGELIGEFHITKILNRFYQITDDDEIRLSGIKINFVITNVWGNVIWWGSGGSDEEINDPLNRYSVTIEYYDGNDGEDEFGGIDEEEEDEEYDETEEEDEGYDEAEEEDEEYDEAEDEDEEYDEAEDEDEEYDEDEEEDNF